MNISQIMEKMIAFSNGNLHDMNHLMCVWTYAKTIGELEGLDRKTQETLEIAAITHDIACPLCREKYGNTNGKRQEEEGVPLVRSFLADAGLSAEQVDRVAYLVSHHHTYTDIDGIDYQILIEADYIVNASESGYSPENRKNFPEEHMKTESGKWALRTARPLPNPWAIGLRRRSPPWWKAQNKDRDRRNAKVNMKGDAICKDGVPETVDKVVNSPRR